MVAPETLSVALAAALRLEKSRSGTALLAKLTSMSDDDLEGLERILDSWTIRDALSVLDEIERRVAVIEAMERLSKDRTTDELTTLHPIVANARWLFGPEFDSPLYTSNVTIRSAVEKVFGKRLDVSSFYNHRNRPDLFILQDGSTLAAVGTDEIDSATGLAKLGRLLIIELKRGGFRIRRDEVEQATNYVDDILSCGLIDGPPFINAYVVGHERDSRMQPVRTIGENPPSGRIEVCTYGQLVRTANQRLFKLRDELTPRYENMEELEMVRRALAPNAQAELALSTASEPENE
jgi:hypothetical protein